PTEIQRLNIELETNGWSFVFLPTELIPNSKLIDELSNFFQSNDSSKRYYSQFKEIYGYSAIHHKEGIKLLTGSYFGEFAYEGLVPRTLIKPLNYISQAFDAVTKRLIEILVRHSVFQPISSLSSLTKHADLPLDEEHFGMLDIVSYFNKKSGFQPPENGKTTDEVNCIPHYDPGLLSISILSTHEGLQLKNMTTNEWIDGPLQSDIGVIWLGEAASRITGNRLKPGIHRVIYPQKSKTRLTIWYELCTVEQLKSVSEESKDDIIANGTFTFENFPGSDPITIKPGEKRLDFLRRIEMGQGVSMSKIGPHYHQLENHNISYPKCSSNLE
ncbi:unnamed protein product, partial [Rotaria sp. Silwood2]